MDQKTYETVDSPETLEAAIARVREAQRQYAEPAAALHALGQSEDLRHLPAALFIREQQDQEYDAQHQHAADYENFRHVFHVDVGHVISQRVGVFRVSRDGKLRIDCRRHEGQHRHEHRRHGQLDQHVAYQERGGYGEGDQYFFDRGFFGRGGIRRGDIWRGGIRRGRI